MSFYQAPVLDCQKKKEEVGSKGSSINIDFGPGFFGGGQNLFISGYDFFHFGYDFAGGAKSSILGNVVIDDP